MRSWRALCALAAALPGTACVYYNAMWSAEHFAHQARSLEAHDRTAEASGYWSEAEVKAESVVARHPKSGWVDDALTLEGEAFVRVGNCGGAALPLGRVLARSPDSTLRERATLLSAECGLATGNPVAAATQLEPLINSRDAGRRSRAAYLMGQAALSRGDPSGAAAWLARSREPDAQRARVRALLAANRVDEAERLLDTLATGKVRADQWQALLDTVAARAGNAAASRALARLLAHVRLGEGARGRLLLADGTRWFAVGELDSAAVRFAAIAALVPDSVEGARARVLLLRVRGARADSLGDLVGIRDDLSRLKQTSVVILASSELRALEDVLRAVLVERDSEATEFRAAEYARDSLRAPRLAGRLFVEFARRHDASLFAPKALVAALPYSGEGRDSILGALDSTYGASPYTLALRGELSPAFQAAEDSLASALGLAPVDAVAAWTSRIALPEARPRGPQLDPPILTDLDQPQAKARPKPVVRPRERP
ncbi:MAG TPA: hypothetical protein VNH63_03855 [Gemmatimonadales bacterium]|nr:hypothetical protein [Gemmatimonadales bacterium]